MPPFEAWDQETRLLSPHCGHAGGGPSIPLSTVIVLPLSADNNTRTSIPPARARRIGTGLAYAGVGGVSMVVRKTCTECKGNRWLRDETGHSARCPHCDGKGWKATAVPSRSGKGLSLGMASR